MTYTSQATRYRETQVMTASPAQLVVMLFDHLLVSLRRARLAIEAGEVELRIALFDKARRVVGELLATLDRERGGEIAGNLAALYGFLLGELLELGRAPDVSRLERVVEMVSELREAFARIAGEGGE